MYIKYKIVEFTLNKLKSETKTGTQVTSNVIGGFNVKLIFHISYY